MFKIRLNYKRLSVWILLIIQIILITSYFYLKTVEYNDEKITFIHNDNSGSIVKKLTYHTISDRIYLRSLSSRKNFINFNSSLCYINGTDLVSMKLTNDYNWQCVCLPGWHGKDCGQPEIIWRAFLTYRKPLKITGPRLYQRRIIYLFKLNKFSDTITEIRLNELQEIVDLFILYENQTDTFIETKLRNNLKEFHNKIIYLKIRNLDDLWDSLTTIVKNLRDDDIILTNNLNEIPNKYALNFLKFYDGWPELIRFRLKWSVYGYFWLHPSQTIITGGACSINYFKNIFNKKFTSLYDNKTLSSPLYKGIILGDLNHYGGWYCELCYDPIQIVDYLTRHFTNSDLLLKRLSKQKIDQNYIEDIIENGLYIDSVTELKRAHRYHDNYFAPYHVLENNWKYDFLLTNFYSKLDYYEG